MGLLRASGELSPASVFESEGVMLGDRIPDWASSGNRWAPENLEFVSKSSLGMSSSDVGSGQPP
jgi:hypothetical protein